MDKYGANQDVVISSLRDEEAQLMSKMSMFMSSGHEKTAEENIEMNKISARLVYVRDTITEHDLRKKQD